MFSRKLAFFTILPLFMFISCYQDKLNSNDLGVLCNLDNDVFQNSIVVKIYDEKGSEIIDSSDISNHQNIEITDRSCLVIPREFRENILLESKTKYVNISPSDLKNDIVNSFRMNTVLDDIKIESTCGDFLREGESFIKIDSSEISGNWYFRDTHNEFHSAEINKHGCIKIPKDRGHLIRNSKIYAIIEQPKPLNFAKKYQYGDDLDFFSACRKEGSNNKIVSLLMDEFREKDCYQINRLVREKKFFLNTFSNKGLEDISALRGLSIKSINLSGNLIKTAKPLGDIVGLEVAYLQNNRVMFFDGMENLKTIDLSSNPIYSLRSIANCSPEFIKINSVPISSLSGLENLPLVALNATNINLYSEEDAIALEKLDSLIELDIRGSHEICLSVLRGNLSKTLTGLRMSDCRVNSLNKIYRYENLNCLECRNNDIRDFNTLKSMSKLSRLIASNNPNANFDNWEGSIETTVLEINNTGTTNLTFLNRGFDKLSRLFVCSNRIIDMTPVSSTPVFEIWASNNPIETCPLYSENEDLNRLCRDLEINR